MLYVIVIDNALSYMSIIITLVIIIILQSFREVTQTDIKQKATQTQILESFNLLS